MSCCATAIHFSWITKAAAKARCNMISLLFCTMPRPICRRSCANNCSITISTGLPVSSNLSAKRSCSTTMPTFTSASCRPWALTAFAAFMSAKLIFCKVCPTRSKTFTGKDAPVIDYLNQQESVHQFLASVMSLVEASLSNYQRRGFKSLMVSFGCTGGRYRSVYLAEQLAKHLRGKNGVEVVVRHLELEKLGK